MSLTQILRCGFELAAVFVLENLCGTRLELCTAGASILRVETSDRNNVLKNIALSFENNAALLASKSYAGATIGPVAGRLRAGMLRLPDGAYSLTRNDGANTLHGGEHGLAQTLWQIAEYGESFISFCCCLPHGLDGFPGNRTICVRYTLNEHNCLRIDYTGKTDRPTVLNLTNHTYWNLTGNFSCDGYAQLLEIAADNVLYNDTAHLPVERCPVRNTAFDFTAPRTLRQAIEADMHNPQLANAHGYNNAYPLWPTSDFAARLTDPISGRRVTLRTDYPSLVLYSGGYLSVPGCALALEAQYLPDSCERVVLPDQVYRHYITFAFDTV